MKKTLICPGCKLRIQNNLEAEFTEAEGVCPKCEHIRGEQLEEQKSEVENENKPDNC